MREKIEKRSIDGKIKITLKNTENPSLSKIWTADKHNLCVAINSIIDDYQEQGYKLTLRQLYYKLVTKGHIPNHITVYKKLSSILDDLRYGGFIDWESIEDRGRIPKLRYYVEDVEDALIDTHRQYRIDRQEGQEVNIELWTEKDAISNILSVAIDPYHIRLVVNKGYTSSSAAYSAYLRMVNFLNQSKSVVILYFGDHDPSGLDMVRDINDRLYNFFYKGSKLDNDVAWNWYRDLLNEDNIVDEFNDGSYYIEEEFHPDEKVFDFRRLYVERHFKIKHIGLTTAQVKKWNPPPNPAKITDPRAKGYILQHGETSWEVDAIEPSDIVKIVQTNVEDIINMNTYNDVLEVERLGKSELNDIIENLK